MTFTIVAYLLRLYSKIRTFWELLNFGRRTHMNLIGILDGASKGGCAVIG